MGNITLLQELNTSLYKLYDHPFLNRNKIKTVKSKIQAISEGQIDVTNTYITENLIADKKVDKNNYKTYATQLSGAYSMYEGKADYGIELLQNLVYTMGIFTAGEGVSAFSKKPATQKFLDNFIKKNKLESYGLLGKVKTGLLEGKNLLLLTKVIDKNENKFFDNSYIKLSSFSFYKTQYNIKQNEITKEIEKIEYKVGEEIKTIDKKQFVFVKLGGIEDEYVNTTNRIHCCLTDIENFSRAKFDLRNNSHLFGKVFPNFRFEKDDPTAIMDAETLKKELNTGNFKPGKSYVGKAHFDLLTPGPGAQAVIKEDMLTALRIISMNTGIPIFLLAWPDLMSNRAVAETMLEQINAATKEERLIWEDAIREVIEKAMVMAIDAGFEREDIIGEFYIKIPFATLFMLEMITKVWQPLYDGKVISMETFRNKIPGINPGDERKLVEEEEEESGPEEKPESEINDEMEDEEIEEEPVEEIEM